MPSAYTSRGAAWDALRLKVLERDSYICAYCGNEATEADHITAKKNGGRDDLSNLVASCKPCNGRKSDKIMNRINYINRKWLNHL